MIPPQIQIRPLTTSAEFQACVRLQEETWGVGFSERVPEAILKVAARMGGVISGGFLPNGSLAGFVFGLTGLEQGELAHWSDMLAVRPEHRGSGLGRALKLHQREQLLAHGVRRVYWTFDPLVTANAHLNFNRLGVVAREYVEDMYQASDSPLHSGIGTDRLVVLWEMDSPRVLKALGGGDTPEVATSAAVLEAASGSEPGEPRLGLDDPLLTVAVPRDIHSLKEESLPLARSWRLASRAALSHYLERGWQVTALLPPDPLPRYLLERST